MTIFAADKLPTSVVEAIQVFDDRHLALQEVGLPSTWASEFGESIETDSPKVTFPYSQLAMKFRETTGDHGFKTFEEGEFEIKTKEYDDGAEADYYKLTKSPWAWKQWQRVPQRMMNAEAQLIASSIAALLANGENIECKPTNAMFFDEAHEANPAHFGDSKTFSNLQSAATDMSDVDNIEAEAVAMSSGVLDENGDVLGVDPDVLLCSPARGRIIRNALKKTYHQGGDTNPEAGEWRVVVAKQLTGLDVYMLDSKLIASGLAPWADLHETVDMALVLRWLNQESDAFVNSGKIKVTKHLWKGFGLVMPYAIRKIKGS